MLYKIVLNFLLIDDNVITSYTQILWKKGTYEKSSSVVFLEFNLYEDMKFEEHLNVNLFKHLHV